MTAGYYQKKTKKGFEKRLVKGIKISPRKKKSKKRQYACVNIKVFSKKKKKKSVSFVVKSIKIFLTKKNKI